MGQHYRQLRPAERIEIGRLRSIAGHLGRSASTISREFTRNCKVAKAWPGGYDPERAQAPGARRGGSEC